MSDVVMFVHCVLVKLCVSLLWRGIFSCILNYGHVKQYLCVRESVCPR